VHEFFEDKNVVITGAEKGIGKVTAQKFASLGAKVAIVGIDKSSGEKTAEELGNKVVFYETDVSKEEEVKKLSLNIKEKMGQVKVLINNAGIHFKGNAVSTNYEDWQKLLQVNLDGVFLMCKYFIAEHMQPGNEGVIVNISSESGIVASHNQVAYNVSKAAVIHLTKSIAVDYAKEGIRANAVCPGTTLTPMVEKIIKSSKDPKKTREKLESVRPLNRLGKPEEIASAVVCMASEELSYATGSILTIDGGSTCKK